MPISIPRGMNKAELDKALRYCAHSSYFKEKDFFWIELVEQLRACHMAIFPWEAIKNFTGLLNIFYPRTQIGLHVEPDPDIRQSTCFPFQLCTYKNLPVDSIAINSLFNDVTIDNITPITTTYQVVQHTSLKRAQRVKTHQKIRQAPTSLPKTWSPTKANKWPSTTPLPCPP